MDDITTSPYVMAKEERIGWYTATVRAINFEPARTGKHFNQFIEGKLQSKDKRVKVQYLLVFL